jgi:hypothetical protein
MRSCPNGCVNLVRRRNRERFDGVSENFLGKIERGSDSVQWGKLFKVLEGMGVRVTVDVPDSVAAYLNEPSSSKHKP